MDSEYRGSRWALAWHELRAMGVSRAWWRARYELRKRMGRVAKPVEAAALADSRAVLACFEPALRDEQELLAHLRAVDDACLPHWENRLQTIAAISLHEARATIDAAEQVLRHRFELMGRTFDFAGREIDWHLDVDSGKSWPRVPWDRIDIRSGARLGDVRVNWELNRHQFWPTLGRAYWLTGDERYAREWVSQFESWLAQNPIEIGVNWLSSLELSVRLISWWMAWRLMMQSPSVTPHLAARMVGAMIASCRHIVADLDYSLISMANNHVIGDAAGLAWTAAALPNLREAPSWRQLGARVLGEQAQRQIHADGTSIECSSAYHRFVLQYYVLMVRLADAGRLELPQSVRPRVSAMAQFLADVVAGDGTVPQFGDNDNGLAYRLGDEPHTDFRPVLSTLAVMFDRPDFAAAAGKLNQETVWLLGSQSKNAFELLAAKSSDVRRTRYYPVGGYMVHRDVARDRVILLKNGPFTGHSHADLLSFSLHDGGRDLLVYSGTFTYNGDWNWRTYFRATRSKNTVIVDGQGQAVAHRVFRFLFPPRARTNFVDFGHERAGRHQQPGSAPLPILSEHPLLYDGQHDGFRRLGVTHRRILLMPCEDVLLCLDHMTGKGRHEAVVQWQLAPELDIVRDPAAPYKSADPLVAQVGGQPVLAISSKDTGGVEMVGMGLRGGDKFLAGWYSRQYGTKEPAWQIGTPANPALPVTVATALTIGPEPAAVVTGIKMETTTVVVQLVCHGQKLTVRYDLNEKLLSGTGETRLGEIVGAVRGHQEILGQTPDVGYELGAGGSR